MGKFFNPLQHHNNGKKRRDNQKCIGYTWTVHNLIYKYTNNQIYKLVFTFIELFFHLFVNLSDLQICLLGSQYISNPLRRAFFFHYTFFYKILQFTQYSVLGYHGKQLKKCLILQKS